MQPPGNGRKHWVAQIAVKRGHCAGLDATGVRSLLVDRRGALWLGTYGHGLVHYLPADGTYRQFSPTTAGPVSVWARKQPKLRARYESLP